MKWHWLRDKEVLKKVIVYCDRGTNNYADYSTKHHPPIHHCQMRPQYIHASNLVGENPETIILYEGVLNRVPGTQFHVDFLKTIQAEPQYMNGEFHMVRRLNCPR